MLSGWCPCTVICHYFDFGKFQEKNIHVILFSELTFAIRTVGSGRQLLKLWPQLKISWSTKGIAV